MKINKFYIGLVALIFFACNPSQKYYGKYYCENNTGAINYLIINKNKTYYHYFKNDKVELSQSGSWKYYDDRFVRIELIDFCDYNENGENYKKIKNYILIKNNNYLNNGFDGNTKSSFKKK